MAHGPDMFNMGPNPLSQQSINELLEVIAPAFDDPRSPYQRPDTGWQQSAPAQPPTVEGVVTESTTRTTDPADALVAIPVINEPLLETSYDYEAPRSVIAPYSYNRSRRRRRLAVGVGTVVLLTSVPTAGAVLMFRDSPSDKSLQAADVKVAPSTATETENQSVVSKPDEYKTPITQEILTPTPTPSAEPSASNTPSIESSPTATVAPPPVIEAMPEIKLVPTILDVTTWNILDTARTGGTPGLDVSDKVRMKGVAEVINRRNFGLTLFQEATALGLDSVLDDLKSPTLKATSLTVEGKHVDEVALYDTELYELAETGTYTIPKMGTGDGYNPDRTRESVWYKFLIKATADSEPRYLYVFGMHADTNPEGRDDAANTILEKIKSINPDADDVVVVAGDANSNYQQAGRRQVYKIFKASEILKLTTFKAKVSKNVECDTQNGFDGKQDCSGHDYHSEQVGSHLDQIWYRPSPGIRILRWENLANNNTVNVSDHTPVSTKISVELPVFIDPVAAAVEASND